MIASIFWCEGEIEIGLGRRGVDDAWFAEVVVGMIFGVGAKLGCFRAE